MGVNITFMERTWEKGSLSGSDLTTVAFSVFGKQPVYFKHKVKGISKNIMIVTKDI